MDISLGMNLLTKLERSSLFLSEWANYAKKGIILMCNLTNTFYRENISQN